MEIIAKAIGWQSCGSRRQWGRFVVRVAGRGEEEKILGNSRKSFRPWLEEERMLTNFSTSYGPAGGGSRLAVRWEERFCMQITAEATLSSFI